MSQQEKVNHQDQENQFKKILKKPLNSLCSDCGANAPSWISLEFGVFLCMNCSGAHRALGQNITRVRSIRLDGLSQEDIDIMENIGNKIANQYWEYRLQQTQKPNHNSSLDELKRFVIDKYIKKLWIQTGIVDPKSRYIQSLVTGVPFNINDHSNQRLKVSNDITNNIKQNNMPPRPNPAAHQQRQKTQVYDDNQLKSFYSDNGQANKWLYEKETNLKFNSTQGFPMINNQQIQQQQQQQLQKQQLSVDLLNSEIKTDLPKQDQISKTKTNDLWGQDIQFLSHQPNQQNQYQHSGTKEQANNKLQTAFDVWGQASSSQHIQENSANDFFLWSRLITEPVQQPSKTKESLNSFGFLNQIQDLNINYSQSNCQQTTQQVPQQQNINQQQQQQQQYKQQNQSQQQQQQQYQYQQQLQQNQQLQQSSLQQQQQFSNYNNQIKQQQNQGPQNQSQKVQLVQNGYLIQQNKFNSFDLMNQHSSNNKQQLQASAQERFQNNPFAEFTQLQPYKDQNIMSLYNKTDIQSDKIYDNISFF